MATWTVKTAAGTRAGLTIYQLQQLVRTGQVLAGDEAATDGVFRTVAEIEPLRRHLPEAAPPVPAGTKTIDIHGIRLELGPDGKPLPPPPEVVATLLARLSDRPRHARMHTVGKALFVVALVFGAIAVLMLVRLMTLAPPVP
jgi:hypothetical protein